MKLIAARPSLTERNRKQHGGAKGLNSDLVLTKFLEVGKSYYLLSLLEVLIA